jgi:hypothetical protein
MKYLTFWNLIKFATGIWLVKLILCWFMEIFKKVD